MSDDGARAEKTDKTGPPGTITIQSTANTIVVGGYNAISVNPTARAPYKLRLPTGGSSAQKE